MPSKNERKQYIDQSYYHVYNRGVNKRDIFYDDQDYRVMLNLFKRHLGSQKALDAKGKPFLSYRDKVELNAFCLMPNHYHFLLYAVEGVEMIGLMQRVMMNYTRYFNTKYSRVGPLFQGRYKASLVDNQSYLSHISRYIHRNPNGIGVDYRSYLYSSYAYYVGSTRPDWLQADRITGMFNGSSNYKSFVGDTKAAIDDVYTRRVQHISF